jgi:hypothetical protein
MTGSQNYPQIAADGAEGAFVVWYDARSSSAYDIYAQHIDSSGVVDWPPAGIAVCTARDTQDQPIITEDGLGGAVAFWRDSRVATYAYDIYAQQIATYDQWGLESAEISGVSDVPEDQGGWARLSFSRSRYDGMYEGSNAITSYYVYRRVDNALLKSRIREQGCYVDQGLEDGGSPASASTSAPYPRDDDLVVLEDRHFLINDDSAASGAPPGTWEVVAGLPAHQEETYLCLVPTVADSSAELAYSVFCISAETATPWVYFFSEPDSGYSIDNLAPSPPPGLIMASGTAIGWDEVPDEDFDYYTVYGSSGSDFDSTAEWVGYTIETSFDVSSDPYDYYHVTATDFAGNEGEASTVCSLAGNSGSGDAPVRFALRQNKPNPFRGSTSIRFGLPVSGRVRIEVYDVAGRRVVSIVDGDFPEGWHTVQWDGTDETGLTVGAGIYFVKMTAGDFRATTKVLPVR